MAQREPPGAGGAAWGANRGQPHANPGQRQLPHQRQVLTTADESEDAEVETIFRSPVTPTTLGSGASGEDYDDFVRRFSGLMGQNVFAAAPPNAAGVGYSDFPRRSQLNANVAAFTPGGNRQQHQQHHHQGQGQGGGYGGAALGSSAPVMADEPGAGQWASPARPRHRTPGPGSGPSPPNPFRYGLGGFHYSAAGADKSGLTPAEFDEEPRGFAAYELEHYAGSHAHDPAFDHSLLHQQQQGDPTTAGHAGSNAWYDHLPQPGGFVHPGDDRRAEIQGGSTAEFDYDFSASFLQHQSADVGPASGLGHDLPHGLAFGGPHGIGFQSLGPPAGSFDDFEPSQHSPYAGAGPVLGAAQGFSNRPRAPPGNLGHAADGAINAEAHHLFSHGHGHGLAGMDGGRAGGAPAGFRLPMGPTSPDLGHAGDCPSPPRVFSGGASSSARSNQIHIQHQHQLLNQVPQAHHSPALSPYGYAGAVAGATANSDRPEMSLGGIYETNGSNPALTMLHGAGSRPQLSATNRMQINSEKEDDERKDRRESAPSSVTHDIKQALASRSDITHSLDSGEPQNPRESLAMRKKQELEETPQTRSIFKEFYKTFRAKEKAGFGEAFSFAKQSLASKDIPERIHWKIYLEMADLAKRENRFKEARELYQLVNETQPYAHQGWLEYSKMEEECGRLHQCRVILHQGLKYCNFAEQLLTKAIKHEERMGNLQGARALLARLRNQSVDKTWRTVLEGALLEARAGNIVVARKVFKYLMRHVQWFGPIYYEATKFEEKNEEFDRAIAIVERGLKEISRYGPLWFNAFRLYEKTELEAAVREAERIGADKSRKVTLLREDVDSKVDLEAMFGVRGDEFQIPPLFCELLRTRGALQRAMNCISKELVWKVHFEAAQVAERGGGPGALDRARHAYVQSILRCPVNLRWKIWLAGARAELAHNHIEKARQLLDRALVDVPVKSRAQVLLECSRLEEYTGDIDAARSTLAQARRDTRSEWKVFLESVMLEVRNGRAEDAIRAAEDALAIHSGTGRLWAVLVQLKHLHGPDAQRLVFREALKQVPKSGEVWCEGSRIHMHPLSPHMDLGTAQRYLQFAIQFTPQFGDSFIELLRLQLLFANFSTNQFLASQEAEIDEAAFRENMLAYDTSELELKCVNADPNYGALWFHCKRGPFDTARQVLRTAKNLLVTELTKFRYVYRDGILDSLHRKHDCRGTASRQRTKARTTPALASGENSWLTERLRHNPLAEQYANFSTGLLSVNWLGSNVNLLADSERRKFLFGSDQIVP